MDSYHQSIVLEAQQNLRLLKIDDDPAILVEDVVRSFGSTRALDGVSLDVQPGEVHALLGRNGAGKTTLLRVLTGLVEPTAGTLRVAGLDVARNPLTVRRLLGLVPSGDRTFYLRLSGHENLVFFARLRGYRRRDASARADRALTDVGLEHAARQSVGTYSHGMQKRLSVARALLHEPLVLLVDEATHDLDPEGARAVRDLTRAAADRGAAVVWATQRVDEIRGLAERLTLLDLGRARFQGTIGELLLRTPASRYVLAVRNGTLAPPTIELELARRLEGVGSISQTSTAGEFALALADGVVLGDALAALLAARITIVSCRQETPEVEDAVIRLLQAGSP